jgi:formate dehydrogenase iron-sulfur subunit
MKAAILTDTTKCIGCNECVIACKKVNHLEPDAPRRWDIDDGLSARNWTSIVEGPNGSRVRKQCRHCVDPACVSACPVGALTKSATGAVVYDDTKCMGCRYCMMACPFGIPRYDWDRTIPYVRKCILCNDRIRAGGQPACTEACPTKATIFGDRDLLLAEAHRRIDANPGALVDKVWGESEIGGTSTLYVSNVDLSFLGAGQPLGSVPLPERTALAMHSVPFAFTGAVAVMAGLNWIIGRRMKRQAEPSDD